MVRSRVVNYVVVAVALVVALASAIAQGPKPPRRVAFLVGINAYQKRGFVNLSWAENDVNETAAELRRLGFEKVVVLTGSEPGDLRATRANIDAQLTRLLADVGKDDIVLVMLCGHGQQLDVKEADGTVRNDGFFCPVDAVLNEPATMVSLSRLTDETLRKWGGKNLVLVDACRDGVVDLDRGVRPRGVQGRVVSLPEGTAVLFSCAAGQRSLERDDLKHGVFTHGVLEVLRDPEWSGSLTWGSLVDRVQTRVADLNVAQEPISAGVMGRLVLASRTRADVKPAAPVMPRVASSDEGTRAGEAREDNGLKMKFRWCPAGSFRMGSPPDEPGRSEKGGQVDVTLTRGFWMGTYEVTQGQWRAVMGTDVHQQKAKDVIFVTIAGEGEDQPMYFVNHAEATEFCRSWTASERAAGRLAPGWEYRLPTEAEWEYACRAGTTSATAFGASLGSDRANFDGSLPYNGAAEGPNLRSTVAVGRYPANAWGLHDMHGNVWEWCGDYYAGTLAGGRDPQGPSTAALRVFRGGCWYDRGAHCRSAIRSGNSPEVRANFLGFRVARVPSGG